ncbi:MULTISPECIES: flagellar assembly protein FliH [Massilia]|uniref:Flagellar assembly protein FliH n=1 Tax=Massilia genomosp. 1 TaxID=2609280 RepID=A0ABX0MU59_9BURK|nr:MULTISPECIES: flagellar assembly protein FliH [Massilia]NHZ62839.1 flagellar assembly protein H [Massilia genomosp. 1]NHZ98776.1 flagellar assembly protein H [Massilia sp. CCM 8734]
MKQFRPYHFPPLSQLDALGAARSSEAAGEWQNAVEEGYQQGQREGYETGLSNGRDDGYATGLAEGLAAGRQQAMRQVQERFDQLAGPLDGMFAQLGQMVEEFRSAQRKEVVDLVGKVARQVIRAELALQPVQLLALVDEALAAMPPTRERIEVCLNPEELKRITELDPVRAAKWSLLPDPSLEAGECRVRAGDNEVDAGCQGRLANCMSQVSTQLMPSAERVLDEVDA